MSRSLSLLSEYRFKEYLVIIEVSMKVRVTKNKHNLIKAAPLFLDGNKRVRIPKKEEKK